MGKVEKLLMSGDNQVVEYNEPEAMRQYSLSLGVSEEVIVLDYACSCTYGTCYRAKSIFGVESALLVTQKFHLPRALFICNVLGVKALGAEANNLNYRRNSLLFWNIREQFATFNHFFGCFRGKANADSRTDRAYFPGLIHTIYPHRPFAPHQLAQNILLRY